MKCIRCGHDSKYKERSDRTCPGCQGRFAFEPRSGDPVTDQFFKNAIEAVSGEGRIRWGIEHLYYDVCRRKRAGARLVAAIIPHAFVLLIVGGFAGGALKLGWTPVVLAALGAVVLAGLKLRSSRFLAFDRSKFDELWDRWCRTHGAPASFLPATDSGRSRRVQSIATTTSKAPPNGKARANPPLEPDIGDYSFDRAVICDRARTVDLLIANNFHFENNCAVLSVDGYPQERFETIRSMLKRNPKLLVVALHDATPEGCRLAQRIADDPAWFGGKLRIIDLGLRPHHARPFHGLLRPSPLGAVQAGSGLSESEAKWFQHNLLELAALRPEQILRRLFNGLQAHANDDVSGGGVTNCGSFDGSSSVDASSDTGADASG